MLTLIPVFERVLKEYVELDLLTNVSIRRTDQGYIVVFTLRKKTDLHSLFVKGGHWPKTWISLDRMLHWLSERGCLYSKVSLQAVEIVGPNKPKPRGNFHAPSH
jgi:hypothetical protein